MVIVITVEIVTAAAAEVLYSSTGGVNISIYLFIYSTLSCLVFALSWSACEIIQLCCRSVVVGFK